MAEMIWGAMSQNAFEQDSGSSQLARSLVTVTAEKTSCDTKQRRIHNILTTSLTRHDREKMRPLWVIQHLNVRNNIQFSRVSSFRSFACLDKQEKINEITLAIYIYLFY